MITISDYVLIYMNPCAHADSLKLFNCKLVKWNYVIEVRFCIKNFQWFRPACHFFPRNFFFQQVFQTDKSGLFRVWKLCNNDDFGPKCTLKFFIPTSQARSVPIVDSVNFSNPVFQRKHPTRESSFLYNKMRSPSKAGGLQ